MFQNDQIQGNIPQQWVSNINRRMGEEGHAKVVEALPEKSKQVGRRRLPSIHNLALAAPNH
eukprot:5749726-Ditylum_brightwellii.AAC.1